VIDNPYWDEVSSWVQVDTLRGGEFVPRNLIEGFELRKELTAKYAWTITSPETVEFVVAHAAGQVVDPMAGTGYWGYLLQQYGIPAFCYDIDPGGNSWHKGAECFMQVDRMDGAEAANKHPDCTLILSWPPHDTPDGYNVLSAFDGRRVIYIGEGPGGCTGDDKLHNALESDWVEVATHWPLQWYGIHDYVALYERA